MIIGLFGLSGGGCRDADRSVLRLHFLDVGYGDAIMIQFPDGTTAMVDAGGHEYAAMVTGYLRRREIRRIDTAVITHPHTNHFEGFIALRGLVDVRKVIINGDTQAEEGYEELLSVFRGDGIPVESMRAGDAILEGPPSVTWQVLHPATIEGSANDNALVTLLTYRDFSVLLTGDIEQQGQKRLINTHPRLNQVDAVKLPHHGGPLTDGFLQGIQSKIYIVSTGANTWGWPREADMDRLSGEVYRTDRDGTIVLETTGSGIKVTVQNEAGDE